MEDTVSLARHERESQGPWEAEVSFGGEADLHNHMTLCDKNPKHKWFVPVEKFTVDWLYDGCRDNDLVNFVRSVSDLTVRVSVSCVSEKRPEVVYGNDQLVYPCYQNAPRDMTRTGTGFMTRLGRTSDIGSDTCQCAECVNSPKPHTQIAYVYINTAAHVICDDKEAAKSTCNFFFDNGSRPDDCKSVVTLRGLSVVYSDIKNDVCTVQYMTHDMGLVDRLEEKIKHLCGLWTTSLQTCSRQEENDEQMSTDKTDDLNILSIIVSHPHGCSKQISVGRYTGTGEGISPLPGQYKVTGSQFGYFYPNTYTAATCPGSSGALVFVVTKGLPISSGRFTYHSGGCPDKFVNFSSLDNLLKGDFYIDNPDT